MTENIVFSNCATRAIPASTAIAVEHDLRDQLTGMVLGSSQTAVAAQLGITVQYLNDILHGKRGISNRIAQVLGWRELVVFVKPDIKGE